MTRRPRAHSPAHDSQSVEDATQRWLDAMLGPDAERAGSVRNEPQPHQRGPNLRHVKQHGNRSRGL
jgi:hypothetical protein